MSTLYKAVYSSQAYKFLETLDRVTALRIQKKIQSVCENPWGLSFPLTDRVGLRKVRVGDYRVIISIEDERVLVAVVKIGHRRNVYK